MESTRDGFDKETCIFDDELEHFLVVLFDSLVHFFHWSLLPPYSIGDSF